MRIYAVALGVVWFVPIVALVVLVTVRGLLVELPQGERVFAAAYFGLFLGVPIAFVLTLIVVPVIALSQWADKAERHDGFHR